MSRLNLYLEHLRNLPCVKKDEREKVKVLDLPALKVMDANEARDEISIIANTHDADLDREVTMPDGAIADSYFFKNKKVFADHDTQLVRAIGSMRWVRDVMEDGRVCAKKVTLCILRNRGNEYADWAWVLATTVGIGASVGFLPIDGRPMTDQDRMKYGEADFMYTSWNWLELSLTAFPCNVACQSDPVVFEKSARFLAVCDMAKKHAMPENVALAFGIRRVKGTTTIIL